MFAPTLDWLYWTIGGAVALVALVLAFRALFRDRARGRFRCPKCWYDLTAPEGAPPALPVMCSECGRETRDARRLGRTRRRWGRVVVAIVMVVAAGLIAVYPGVHRNGWWSLVPTWFIVDTMPVFGYPTVLTEELFLRAWDTQIRLPGRAKARPLSTGERAYVLNRIASGTWLARPTSDRWKRTFGQVLQHFGFMLPNAPSSSMPLSTRRFDPAIEKAIDRIREIPPGVELRTRDVWPEGVPLWIELSSVNWWALDSRMAIGVRRHASHRWDERAETTGIVITASDLHPVGSIELQVRMEWGKDSDWSDKHVAEFEQSVPYRIGGSVSEALVAVIDPAIETYLESIVYVDNWAIQVRPNPMSNLGIDGLAYGVIVEYARDGEVVSTYRMWWSGEPKVSTGRSGGSDGILGKQWRRRNVVKPGENWTVRIRSDPETALRVIDADKYWQGDVTVNLTIP